MFLAQTLNFLISFAVVTILFALIYKVVPDVRVAWRDVWIGALVTAFLFAVGKWAIGLYLGNSAPGSTYGAAGSLIVLLLWVYYSAQILFLGAEFTQVYANKYGSRIVADETAVSLTLAARAQQGIPLETSHH
ncbi:MAG: YihY/virulence factor BrkB family protein [Anaerolineales bacterium]|nr:YihY/virulence factor BrkB family protein [Anaerolineales bacterium]